VRKGGPLLALDREREQFYAYLRRNGHRITRERRVLFDEVFSRHGHLDADQLLAAMRRQGVKISRATVYRNLDLLVESGLVRRYRLGGNRYLHEHVHVGQSHDHLVCRSCGRVVEFVSPGIAALQAEICKAHNFDPGDHHLTISSICDECAGSGVAGRGPSHSERRRPA